MSDTLTIPYADAVARGGRLYRDCPACHRLIPEATDADGEQTTNAYGEHYQREHASLETRAAAVIARYDRIVRENRTPEWDTIAAVATCNEGLYGAFGEVLDTATETLGHPRSDALDAALETAFRAYQARLRAELADARTGYVILDCAAPESLADLLAEHPAVTCRYEGATPHVALFRFDGTRAALLALVRGGWGPAFTVSAEPDDNGWFDVVIDEEGQR